jgi:hypothetical protein
MKARFLTIGLAMLTFGTFAQCDFQKNEVDEFTGKVVKVLKPELFIAHTDSSLKKYYRKRDYLTITTKVAHIGGIDVLYFTAIILNKEAYKYYGSLRKGSKVMLKLKNGEMISVEFDTSDFGEVDYDRSRTTYSNYCAINDEQKEMLKSSEVDKVRIYWSEGYEDYECDNSDVYVTQLSCLN